MTTKLRITRIDFPQHEDRIKVTLHRLTRYANMFKVPFEFYSITKSWDTINCLDLNARPDEVNVISSMYRLTNLLDENVVANGPRDRVLNLNKEVSPKVFILGVANGAYSNPSFIRRSKKALIHYGAL
ncbi:hypothetical protein V6N13_028206 [Hibiscus sabdariffa]|uniref:Uncharacterized protein n=1 Tax=Hibiscus sabdariffa TaxID=183260 RepID=A0ABR2DBF5_9ROSI